MIRHSLLVLFLATSSAAQNPFLTRNSDRRIGEISFFGNTVTKEYILRREFGIRSGDSYSPVAISDGWARLEALEFIAYVDIQEKRNDDQVVDLVLTIAEDDRFAWSPTLRYERSYDGVYGGLNLQMLNLRGRAEALELAGRVGALHGGWLRWENPGILGPAAIALFAETTWHRHDFSYEDFRLRNAFGRLGIGRDLGRWARASLSYTLREVAIDEVGSGFSEGTARDDAVEISLEHDSRDIRYYPTKGVHAEASARFSSIAQERPYQLYRLHASAFANVPIVDILCGRISYRFGGQALPIYERGQLGGPGDQRALDFGALDGDATILGTLEVRRPLFLLPLREGRAVGLGLHAFHDWGKAFEHGAGFDSAPVWRGFGAGLHVNLNTLNLRFEWAQDESGENRFVFEDSFTF